MNILFVLENYHPHIGGVESVFQGLAEGLAARGHRVTLVTRRLPATAKQEVLRGVRIIRAASFGSRHWFTFTAFPAALRWARWADIVHTTTYNGAPPAWLAARIFRKPAVITVHEALGPRWATLADVSRPAAWLYRTFERMILRLGFARYAAVSRSTARQLLQTVRAKHRRSVQVVYNGLDYGLWRRQPAAAARLRRRFSLAGRFVSLFYGRPGVSKGLEVLLRALPLIVQAIPSFHLVAIVSEDRAYHARAQRLRSLADQLGMRDHVLFLSPRPRRELPAYVAMADCVVVPSLSEGFGFAVAEACAIGKIVVASNTDSIPEVVSGKWLLFDAGSPLKLAEAVVDVYYGRYHRTRLRRFSIKQNIKNYLKAYSNAISHGA